LHAGENEDRSPADFVKPVDARQVGGWILPYTVLRFPNKVVALSELGGASGTDLGACRGLAVSYAIRTHNAFADPRVQGVPLILRLGKSAGSHAIPAANTLPDVVYDWTFLRLMESSDRTNRCAGRMLAVHAQAAHEFVVLGQNDGKFVFRLHGLRRDFVVVRQLILLRTGTFALLATDAHGRVIQQGLTHDCSSLLPSGTSVPAE